MQALRRFFLTAALLVAAAPAMAQVGVAINVGAPNFYGQITLGNAPPPQLVYARPMVITPAPQYVGAPPIYLHVPPDQSRHWSRHCAAYNACGRPVYFVQDSWYRNNYVPYYRKHHGKHVRPRPNPGHGHYKPQRGDHNHAQSQGRRDRGGHGQGQGRN